MEHTCPECGKIYNSRSSGQVCCSHICSTKRVRRNASSFIRKCIICGKTYESRVSNSIYCSKRCKLDAIKIRPYESLCKWCGKTYFKFKGKLYCSDICKRLSKQNIRKINMKNNINLKLICYLRHYLFRAIKGKQYNSKYYLGFTVKNLRDHLESRFTFGMSWDNYGEWHIDHVKPLISFNFYNEDGTENIEEIRKAMSLSNLQPLWARDNISKGGKWPLKQEA